VQPAGQQPSVESAQMQQMAERIREQRREQWDGQFTYHNTFIFRITRDADLRAAWNISDEQFEYIQNLPSSHRERMNEHPEYQKMEIEFRAAMAEIRAAAQIDPSTGAVDEATMGRMLSVQQSNVQRMNALSREIIISAIDNVLTPEQQQKIEEAFLAEMGNQPFVSPSMFEVLNLTDTQREQMEKIKKELEPEFERELEDYVSFRMFWHNRLQDELAKLGGFTTNTLEMQERQRAASERLMEAPEFRRIMQETLSNSRAFAVQFQTRMFDVLTDEQWERLQYLVDNPPHLVHRRAQEEPRRESDIWVPGTGSWRPGDPIPGAYRQQRNTRGNFPRPAN